ncbi:MAG: NAD(P)/FAD-dependent oxidoreductase [Candidatus Aminicenantia bacterium]
MRSRLTLKNGAQIAIIGGGPAGTFFAHFARKFAQKKGIEVSTTIFDGKDFLHPGPKGCNLCAGVISETLIDKLEEEGIFLPEERVLNRIEGYCFHIREKSIILSHPENKKAKIAAVFRGNGPRYSSFPENISFDDFLLSFVIDEGTKIIPHPVWDIKFPKDKVYPLSVFYGPKNNPLEFKADLVVGAFGLNLYLMKKMVNLGFGYRPPSTLTTYQAELKLGQQEISKYFGNNIHIYLPKSKKIRYVTIVPKREYITVSIIGRKDATQQEFLEFLELKEIQDKISFSQSYCFCRPKIVTTPSHTPFSDRLIMIGDASFSRYYKSGIESAFVTAQLASETAINFGVDISSFYSRYYNQAKRLIIRDNYYGRLLFFMNDIISSASVITQAHLSLAEREKKSFPSGQLRNVLWNMFTGNVPYKKIFRDALNLKLQIVLFQNIGKILLQKIKNFLKRK